MPDQLRVPQLLDLLEVLRDAWRDLLFTDLPSEATEREERRLAGELSLRTFVVAFYYDELVRRLLDSDYDFVQPWPVFSLADGKDLADRALAVKDPGKSILGGTYVLVAVKSRAYQFCRIALFLLRERADALTPDLTSSMTWAGVLGMRDLFTPPAFETVPGLERTFAKLGQRCAEDWAKAHADDGFILRSDYRAALSKAELKELEDLAQRTKAAVARCGSPRAVDRLFEDRLEQMLQSLGFVVVRAQPGTRAGDLLCLSSEGPTAFSLLLEAKTTGKPYTLPTSDARAIKEYVERIRARLSLTPPLRFVLVISREPARTVARKLRDLEAQVEVPIRYIEARQLGLMQRALAGGNGLVEFVEAVLAGPSFVGDETLEALASARDKRASQWTDLIQTALTPVRP